MCAASRFSEKRVAREIGDDLPTGVEGADSAPQQQGDHRPREQRARADVHQRAIPYSHGDGQGGIRTLDTLAGIPVFETGGFNRSPTCPDRLDACLPKTSRWNPLGVSASCLIKADRVGFEPT